jgi:hypothetical protein
VTDTRDPVDDKTVEDDGNNAHATSRPSVSTSLADRGSTVSADKYDAHFDKQSNRFASSERSAIHARRSYWLQR